MTQSLCPISLGRRGFASLWDAKSLGGGFPGKSSYRGAHSGLGRLGAREALSWKLNMVKPGKLYAIQAKHLQAKQQIALQRHLFTSRSRTKEWMAQRLSDSPKLLQIFNGLSDWWHLRIKQVSSHPIPSSSHPPSLHDKESNKEIARPSEGPQAPTSFPFGLPRPRACLAARSQMSLQNPFRNESNVVHIPKDASHPMIQKDSWHLCKFINPRSEISYGEAQNPASWAITNL